MKRHLHLLLLASFLSQPIMAATILDFTQNIISGVVGDVTYIVHSNVATLEGTSIDLVISVTGSFTKTNTNRNEGPTFTGVNPTGDAPGLARIDIVNTTAEMLFSLYESGTYDPTTNTGTAVVIPEFLISLYDVDGDGRERISFDVDSASGDPSSSASVIHTGSGLVMLSPTDPYDYIWTNDEEVSDNPSDVNNLNTTHVNNSITLQFTNTSSFNLTSRTTHSRAMFYSGALAPEPGSVFLSGLGLSILLLRRRRCYAISRKKLVE